MRNLIKYLVNKFLTEDMFKQVRTVQSIAILGFILFFLVLIYLWQFKIDITVPTEDGREVIGQKNIFELLIEKR